MNRFISNLDAGCHLIRETLPLAFQKCTQDTSLLCKSVLIAHMQLVAVYMKKPHAAVLLFYCPMKSETPFGGCLKYIRQA